MSVQAILLPLFVEVLLTFVLLIWMGRVRVAAVQSGEVQTRDIALRQPNWPPRVLKIANAYHNQLETPVLFYVLTALAMITRHADLLFVIMAWIFVVSRLGHAFIHVTSNRVSPRFFAFLAGTIVLVLMWLIFMIRILLGLG